MSERSKSLAWRKVAMLSIAAVGGVAAICLFAWLDRTFGFLDSFPPSTSIFLSSQESKIPSKEASGLRPQEIETAIKTRRIADRDPIGAIDDLARDPRIFAITQPDSLPWIPVSMTPVGEGEYIIANYRDLYILNEDLRTIIPLRRPSDIKVWDPTAVTYSNYYNLLIVANYTGEDVLAFRLEKQNGEYALTLVDRIADPEWIHGPEGIAISAGGRYLAIANADGANVALFEREGNKWRPRWRKPLNSAHGVTIVGATVYASGTELIKLDVDSGAELIRTGMLGPEAIIFATTIEAAGPNKFLVTDPEAGRVYVVDQDFGLISKIGQNGPTYHNLDMPYAAYSFNKKIFIISTYQNRIISVDATKSESWQITDGWRYLPFSAFADIYGDLWTGAVKTDSPSITMFGDQFRASYGALQRLDGKKGSLMLPSRGRLFLEQLPQWPYYVVSATEGEEDDLVVIVANSSPLAIVYENSTGAAGIVNLNEWDCWALADQVVCPSRSHSLGELKRAVKFIGPAASLAAIANATNHDETFIRSEFTSSAGKAFLEAMAGDSGAASVTRAAKLYKDAIGASAVPFAEEWIVELLSRSPPDVPTKH